MSEFKPQVSEPKPKRTKVCVLNMRGEPLMPCSPVKARKLLKAKKAVVKHREPFTIQLTVASGENRQDITLGVDLGSRHVGFSASTKKDELYAAEVDLRPDVSKQIAQRRELRRTRRSRKTRHRPPRFDNRVRSKNKGWLAPSIEHKISSTISRIEAVKQILPVKTIVVEVGTFDTQLLQNPSISGKQYQQGPQLNFYNVREYVFWRDQYTCQHCHGKSKDPKLHVHHLESRLTGGNAPNNLVTLCSTCHQALHAGQIKLVIKRGSSFKDAAYMNITRKTLVKRLQAAYPNLKIRITYGYITKFLRDKYHIGKTHHDDAFCIAGNMDANRLGCYFYQKQVRRHNRQIHKINILKGGRRKKNQAAYEVKGFRLFDKVRCEGQVGFIFGRRSTGYFDVRRLDGTRISASVSYKKLRLLQKRKSYLTELRTGGGNSSPALEAGVSLP